MTESELNLRYTLRHEVVLSPLADSLVEYLSEILSGVERIDRVQARAKSPSRFMAKATKEFDGQRKYSDPINEIQDQVGARIITFYLDDVDEVVKKIDRYFHSIEKRKVAPDNDREFGYFGTHYIVPVPTDILRPEWGESQRPEFFELQVKTLFQHAWSEANHDLGYKQLSGQIGPDEHRKMAWASAQAWGADRIFNELVRATQGK